MLISDSCIMQVLYWSIYYLDSTSFQREISNFSALCIFDNSILKMCFFQINILCSKYMTLTSVAEHGTVDSENVQTPVVEMETTGQR